MDGQALALSLRWVQPLVSVVTQPELMPCQPLVSVVTQPQLVPARTGRSPAWETWLQDRYPC